MGDKIIFTIILFISTRNPVAEVGVFLSDNKNTIVLQLTSLHL